MNIPSLAACIGFIANKVAELPIKLYQEDGEETKELKDDDRIKLLNDATGDLLDVYQLKHAVVRDFCFSEPVIFILNANEINLFL